GPYKDQFLMGVQWHPEFGASPLAPKLVQSVIDHAVQYRKTHPRDIAYEPQSSFLENVNSSLNVIKEPLNQPESSPLNGEGKSMLDYIQKERQRRLQQGQQPSMNR